MSGYRPGNRGNRSANRTGSYVSARLRKAGINVSPAARKHKHNGLFVSGGPFDRVHVLVDLGTASGNRRGSSAVIDTVVDWPQVGDIESKIVDDVIHIWFDYTAGNR